MLSIHENYVTDPSGKRTGVIIGMEEYHRILDDLEELEAIKAFDAAKAVEDEEISFEQAMAEIESH